MVSALRIKHTPPGAPKPRLAVFSSADEKEGESEMKKLMNRAGLLAVAFALALAVALALNAAGQTPVAGQTPAASPTPTVTPTQTATQALNGKGSDTDGNGLIEIDSYDKFNAMRYDPDGDGSVSGADHSEYARFFVTDPCSAAVPCKGYELTTNVSLASDYEPIGSWRAIFDGNGFNITGLVGNHGLFGDIGVGSGANNAVSINDATVVKNVDVLGAKIDVDDNQGGPAGALARVNYATIVGSHATGEITRNATANNGALGGLVGHNWGTIAASVADVNVKVKAIPVMPSGRLVFRVGGFVGVNYGAIHGSYAYGNVIDARSDDDREATNSGRFRARGFAVNNATRGRGGTIDSSLSYGYEIVTDGDAENAAVRYKGLAVFVSSPSVTNSCALRDESKVTCPPPTPTPTLTPTPTPTPIPID